MQRFDAWLGKQVTSTDSVTAAPIRRLAALLDHIDPPWPDNELPPLGHWLFHLTDARQSELDVDGHPLKGGFMPPVPLPRRMWAGSRIRFLQSVAIGSHITRRSRISRIDVKSAASGERVFITLRNEIVQDGNIAIEEDQDIVYLGDTAGQAETHASVSVNAPLAQTTRHFRATPEMLFRFSALTFNAHKIHYDRDYARSQEHYPGLVVQGPLLATLLADQFSRQYPAARVSDFNVRAREPIFDTEPFDLCLAPNPTGADLWVLGLDGRVKMTATIATKPLSQLFRTPTSTEFTYR